MKPCYQVSNTISISDVVHAVRLTAKRRVSLEEQELLTLPEHLSSPPIFSGVRVAQSLGFCVLYCRSIFVLFILVIYIVCPLIYGFLLPLCLSLVSSKDCLQKCARTLDISIQFEVGR